MKRVLITGGAGFIGSHLTQRLLDQGHRVIVFDNFFTGRHENLARPIAENLQLAVRRDIGHLEVVRGDVCDPMHFEVDEIYHLACPASPVHYQRNPVRTIKTCVEGTLHALELARETGARVLIASTSEVYGDPLEHPQSESYHGNVNPTGPRACYDEGKRCGEALATSYAQQFDVDVRIARIFNTYGPRMAVDDGRVISNFVVQALRGEPLTIYGDGEQTRSFMYVDDLVEALLRLMNAELSIPLDGVPATPVNLGNPREFTIGRLAELVAEMVRGTGIVRLPAPQDDPRQRKPDISLAMSLLDWNPKVPLEEGLRRTVDYFRSIVSSR